MACMHYHAQAGIYIYFFLIIFLSAPCATAHQGITAPCSTIHNVNQQSERKSVHSVRIIYIHQCLEGLGPCAAKRLWHILSTVLPTSSSLHALSITTVTFTLSPYPFILSPSHSLAPPTSPFSSSTYVHLITKCPTSSTSPPLQFSHILSSLLTPRHLPVYACLYGKFFATKCSVIQWVHAITRTLSF